MTKLYVTGAVGSGKTYAAVRLSELVSIPVCSLDEVYFDLEAMQSSRERITRSTDERDRALRQALARSAVIFEGWHFGEWLTPMYRELDAVVVIDTPLDVRERRIRDRFDRRKRGLEHDPFPQSGPDHLERLLRWSRDLWDERKVIGEVRAGAREDLTVYKTEDIESFDAQVLFGG